MGNNELKKQIRILQRKLARSEESRALIEEALESHIRALSVSNAELVRSHHFIKSSEEKFKQLALYDALTQLPTRTLFKERFEMAMLHANRGKSPLAVLFIDVDNFKNINDTYGHDAGDGVLQEIGSRLVSSVRDIDTVARLSGDEFVVLLETPNGRPDAEHVADRILSTTTKQPVDLQTATVTLSLSIGVSLYPSDGSAPDELLKKADIAMYTIKKAHGNAWAFFEDLQGAFLECPIR